MTFARRIVREPGDRKVWLLSGPRGVVQFLLLELTDRHSALYDDVVQHDGKVWMAADVGYHSPRPRYGSQEAMGPCEYLDGVQCYYDGSGMAAIDLAKKWAEHGYDEEVIWESLAGYYVNWLLDEEGEEPEVAANPVTALLNLLRKRK